MFNLRNPYDLGFWALFIGTLVVGIGGMFLFSFWFLLVNAAYLGWMFFGGGTDWFAERSVTWDFSQMSSASSFPTPVTETTNEAPTTTDTTTTTV